MSEARSRKAADHDVVSDASPVTGEPAALGDYGNVGRHGVEVEVVRAIYDAFARRDLEALLGQLSDGVVFFPMGTASLVGRGEPYRGHDGVRRYFADLARAWDQLVLHPDDVRAVTGGVVIFGRAEGLVDGAKFARRVMWTWRLRDGKVASMRATPLGEL